MTKVLTGENFWGQGFDSRLVLLFDSARGWEQDRLSELAVTRLAETGILVNARNTRELLGVGYEQLMGLTEYDVEKGEKLSHRRIFDTTGHFWRAFERKWRARIRGLEKISQTRRLARIEKQQIENLMSVTQEDIREKYAGN